MRFTIEYDMEKKEGFMVPGSDEDGEDVHFEEVLP